MKLDGIDRMDWSLLARYFSGVCSVAEKRAVEEWIAGEPQRRREVTLLRAAWEQAARMPFERDVQDALRRVATRTGAEISSAEPGVREFPRLQSRRWEVAGLRRGWQPAGMQFAVAVAVVAVLWIGWMRFGGPRASDSMREFTTQHGERAAIELKDGTKVTLGPASSLQVPANLGARERLVTLDGEASFIVAHDARRPFRVRAGTTLTEDLGTTFVIEMRRSQPVVDVVVVEGEVALRPDGSGTSQGVKLSRGQRGRVGPSGLVTVTDHVDAASLLRWLNGRLEFHRTPLADVLEVLGRWYGVRIALPDSTLSGVPVTASFDGEPVDDALGTLARLLDVRYERHDSTAQFLVQPRR